MMLELMRKVRIKLEVRVNKLKELQTKGDKTNDDILFINA